MSFSWTVVTKPSPHEPWKNERFRGYFTDVRRAARKSLPRKPNPELRDLLGLSLVATDLEGQRGYSTGSSASQSGSDLDPEAALVSRTQVIQTANREPDINKGTRSKSAAETFNNCTFREKTLCAVAIYLAFMLALLLIIILVLTLNVDRSGDDTSNTMVILTTARPRPSSTQNPPPPTGTTDAPLTSSQTTPTTGLPNSTQTTEVTTLSTATTTSNETNAPNTAVTTSAGSSTVSFDSDTSSTVSSTSPSGTELSTVTPRRITPPTALNTSITCKSEACLAANVTMTMVNASVSPCADFYQFACGNWNENIENTSRSYITNRNEELRLELLAEIKDILDQSSQPTDTLGSHIANRLYRACLETNEENDTQTDTAAVHDVMVTFGVVPGGNITSDLSDMWKLADSRFYVSPLFDSTVVPVNVDGVQVYGIRLEPPIWTVRPSSYQVPLMDDKTAIAYINATAHLLHGFLKTFTIPTSSTTSPSNSTQHSVETDFDWVYQKVLAVYYLEAIISSMASENSGNQLSSETTVTTSQLRELYPHIDAFGAFSGLHDEATIIITHSNYLSVVNSLLVDPPSTDDVKWFVLTRVILESILPVLTRGYREMFPPEVVNHDLSDINCVEKSLQLISEDIHVLYVNANTQKVLSDRLFKVDTKNRLTAAFREMLSSSSWVQADMSLVLDVLLKNMDIEFSPVISLLQDSNISALANRTLLSLSLELMEIFENRKYAPVGANVSDQIDAVWTDTLPLYKRPFNRLDAATGMTVYLTFQRQSWNLYSYLGNLMSEAILDILLGGKHVPDVPSSWWDTGSQTAFRPMEECFRKQISELQVSPDLQSVLRINGAMQLSKKVYEQAADSRKAETVPGTLLTEEMLFYINSAQLHCTRDDGSEQYIHNKHRVNNMITNNADLINLFDCSPESHMVTSTTCSLFGQ